jgi:hypothetical protein
MDTCIRVIPDSEQRYPTCGDWWYEADGRHIRVSKSFAPEHEELVAIHEYIECVLCAKQAITETAVSDFDREYERTRLAGHAPCGCKHFDEPGDDPHAPYYRQHQIATGIEHLLAIELGINWQEHNSDIETD